MRWLLIVLMLPLASAAPWVVHSDGADIWLAEDGSTPVDDHADGRQGSDSVLWAASFNQTLDGVMAGVLSANVTLVPAIPANVDVAWTLENATEVLASGAAVSTGLITERTTLNWTIALNASWSGLAWWNITAEGTFVGLSLDTSGATNITLPRLPPAPLPVLEFVQLTGAPVSITVDGGPAPQVTTIYTWFNATPDVNVDVSATVLAGRLNITVLDGAGDVVARFVQSGSEAIRNATAGNWTLFVQRTDLDGEARITMAPWVAPPDVAPKARDSPAGLLVIVALLIAARRPRSL